jgi:hypothetical protein
MYLSRDDIADENGFKVDYGKAELVAEKGLPEWWDDDIQSEEASERHV